MRRRYCRVQATYLDGDTAIQQAVFEGTHTGSFNVPEQPPIGATNKKVHLPFVNILTTREGKVSSWLLYFDRAELLAQLGVGG